MKKHLIFCIPIIFGMILSGCSSSDNPSGNSEYEVIMLTEEEVDIIEAIGDDVHKVSSGEYASIISAIEADLKSYVGSVYQFEGLYKMIELHGENTPYLVSSETADAQTGELGLPLQYVYKEIAEGAPIRVTAIISEKTHDGHTHAILDVVAVESVQIG